ncbi:NADPH-dependent FMN reductase [Olsenella profusa]|uniref:Flavin reductase n=1 Tax=Olsenella profusa F0195 TaxID=1125712 RepID=U2V4R3_9ACTN|nr:NADPH-dependent FMN reductase [Olsenella profusa]ERL07656.1 flavin reductase [Olsenella profusa F0195]
MKQIAFVLGSNRQGSFNAQLMTVIKDELAGRADIVDLDAQKLPRMSQDLEWPTPEAVADARKVIEGADGLWIVSPQYNCSYPGYVKDFVDWMSRPVRQGSAATVIKDKKVTLSGIGGRTATAEMRAQLGSLLSFVGADVMGGAEATGEGFSLAPAAWGSGVVELDDGQRARVRRQVSDFLAFIA